MPRDGAGRRRSRKVLRPRSINGIRTLSPQEVHERLAVHYGPVEWAPRADGMTELVQTILSQHTSDRNSGRAFAELWRTFRSWEAVLQAPTEQVMASIRQGGLARQKAPRIQAVLAQIWERRGDFDLSFLEALPLEEAKAWLTSLPGVGPKTAAIVLCFALGMPAFAIDTHIHRVTRRLGLIVPGSMPPRPTTYWDQASQRSWCSRSTSISLPMVDRSAGLAGRAAVVAR